MEDFKANGFLALNAKWVEGVEQIDAKFVTDLLNEAHSIIEIPGDLNGGSTIGQRLRQFAAGDVASREEDDAAQACLSGIGG